MNASKEECREAIRRLKEINNGTTASYFYPEMFDAILAFLKAAERKLPYEKAYVKEKSKQ